MLVTPSSKFPRDLLDVKYFIYPRRLACVLLLKCSVEDSSFVSCLLLLLFVIYCYFVTRFTHLFGVKKHGSLFCARDASRLYSVEGSSRGRASSSSAPLMHLSREEGSRRSTASTSVRDSHEYVSMLSS